MAFFRRHRSNGRGDGRHGSAAAAAPGAPNRLAGDPVEALTQQIGRELLDRATAHTRGVFSSRVWSDKLMEWATKDPGFKVQLFRFIDAFPTLTTPEQVHEHLADYLNQPGVTLPPGLSLGLSAGGLMKGALSSTIARQVRAMAEKFIAGRDAAEALPRLRELWDRGICFSVDLLGEACLSDAEAAAYQQRYLDLIQALPDQVSAWPANPRLDSDYLGAIPRTNVSIKISSVSARTRPIDTEGSIRSLLEALRPILDAARQHNVLINFDMEQHALKDLTIELFLRCCEQIDFPAGLALQAYLRSGEADAQRVIDWAKRTGRQVIVRLIKGAYWDYETIHAEQMGWPTPVWSRKSDTDACFERMAGRFISQMPRTRDQGGVKLAIGTHNARSIAHALAVLKAHDLPPNAIELQMLHGMADELKGAAVEMGLRLREYVPVGQMIPGMAYLVRRLLENTSNESWLRAGFLENVSVEELLRPPLASAREQDPGVRPLVENASRHQLSAAIADLGNGLPFFSEPVHDWSDAAQRQHFAEAITQIPVPKVAIDATVEQADAAVARAITAFPAWRDADPKHRAGILLRAASLLRQKRDIVAGVVIREAGKPWAEADADVCEAIDFCEYYAREAVGLFTPQRLGRFVGELNEQWHQPRGVAVVISPWNFPIAIPCGMTVAALVTGNATILKPAEQTPGIAKVLCDVLWEAGVPRDVLQFIPGQGETVGAAMVRDPRVAIIAFTGSKQVGLEIIREAGSTADQQMFVKKVVCEMGGKNAIIVDASADLDEAVAGVRQSAFGYAGQKCSACSRVIVVESAYELFLHRLVEATRALVIGDATDASTDVGPVIDAEAAAKIRRYIEIGKSEARLALACEVPAGLESRTGRQFVGPHIFAEVSPDAVIARDEIFGPVLSVMRIGNFEQALQIANASPYKLTGGVFSRKPSHLAQARREFRVGNLYLNRGITGAQVGRQPFGGFGLSGVGSKAGGHEYLLQFVEPRTCTENTMRRGFAPGMEVGAGEQG